MQVRMVWPVVFTTTVTQKYIICQKRQTIHGKHEHLDLDNGFGTLAFRDDRNSQAPVGAP